MLLASLIIAPALTLAGEKVNINTADAETLAQSIQGVGPARAKAIVAYREKHGPFRSVDDLALVQGIGEKMIDNNRDRLTAE
jgi:competence protein ComEA